MRHIVGKLSRRRRVTVESAVIRSDPDITVSVLAEPIDHVTFHGIVYLRVTESLKPSRVRCHIVYTAIECSYPYSPLTVFEHRVDESVGQRERVGFLFGISLREFGDGIQQDQAGVATYQQDMRSIFYDRVYMRCAAYATGQIRLTFSSLIYLHQSVIPCTEPDIPFGVFGHGERHIVFCRMSRHFHRHKTVSRLIEFPHRRRTPVGHGPYLVVTVYHDMRYPAVYLTEVILFQLMSLQ